MDYPFPHFLHINFFWHLILISDWNQFESGSLDRNHRWSNSMSKKFQTCSGKLLLTGHFNRTFHWDSETTVRSRQTESGDFNQFHGYFSWILYSFWKYNNVLTIFALFLEFLQLYALWNSSFFQAFFTTHLILKLNGLFFWIVNYISHKVHFVGLTSCKYFIWRFIAWSGQTPF